MRPVIRASDESTVVTVDGETSDQEIVYFRDIVIASGVFVIVNYI